MYGCEAVNDGELLSSFAIWLALAAMGQQRARVVLYLASVVACPLLRLGFALQGSVITNRRENSGIEAVGAPHGAQRGQV